MVSSNDEITSERRRLERPLDTLCNINTTSHMSPFDVSRHSYNSSSSSSPRTSLCTSRGGTGAIRRPNTTTDSAEIKQNNLNGRSHGPPVAMELVEAVKSNDERRCDYLLRNGRQPDVEDDWNRSALFWAALRGNRRISEMLIVFGARVDRLGANGLTALHGAAQRGSVEVTDLLVKRGLDINQQSEEGDTALHIAAHCGHLLLVRFLLPHADVTITNRRGLTAADESEAQGHTEIVELFRKLRVHLPLTRTRSVLPANGSCDSMHSAEQKQLNVIPSPALLRVAQEDLVRSKSAPLAAEGWNIPPRIENARSQEHLTTWRGTTPAKTEPGQGERRANVTPSAHECCACATRLRQKNRELRNMCEDLQLQLTLERDQHISNTNN